MKLNIDCVRDVLLLIEEQPFNTELGIKSISERLPNYSVDELEYTCLKLNEGGYIKAVTMSTLEFVSPRIISVQELTYAGHQFIDNIRNDYVFDETKTQIANTVGSASMNIISNVASTIILKLLGL